LGLSGWHEDLDQLNIQFETGQISENIYRRPSKFIPNASADEILQAWSAILLISLYRLSFYKCIYKIPLIFTQ
jgi:putative hydrolase of the HAD superfamily